MASKTPSLQIHHLKDLASIIKREKRTTPTLSFLPLIDKTKAQPVELVAYSDAALCGKGDPTGRAGYVIFRKQGDCAHPISWQARKLRRIARSSATAELLAAADATSHLLYLKSVLMELTEGSTEIYTRLVLDSQCLYRLCYTTNSPLESRNKIDLAAIRESLNKGELSAVTWQPGLYHVADALTKDNRVTAALLAKVLREGLYAAHPSSISESGNTIDPNIPAKSYDLSPANSDDERSLSAPDMTREGGYGY